MKRLASRCVMAVVLVMLMAPAAALADQTIDFETPALANGTVVGLQFRDAGGSEQGVTFQSPGAPEIGTPPSVPTLSGTHALCLPACSIEAGAGGFSTTGFFGVTRQTVSVHMRNITGGDGDFPSHVQLLLFDSAHHPDGSASATLDNTSSGWTTLTASSLHAADDVQSFEITAPSTDAGGIVDVLDDLTLDVPATPPAPDYYVEPPPVLHVSQGTNASELISISRSNMSTGRIEFSAANLPPGVSAAVTPSILTGDAAYVQLTLTAASDAPTGPTQVTLNSQALDTAAGPPGLRQTTIPIDVQTTCSDPSFAPVHVTGCWQRQSANPNLYDSTAADFQLNGMQLHAAHFEIDPVHRTLTSAFATVLAGGVPVYAGPVEWQVPVTPDGDGNYQVFTFDLGNAAKNLLKPFPVSANVTLSLRADGAQIPVGLQIPIPGVSSGDDPTAVGAGVTLTWHTATGFELTALHIHIEQLPLGALTLKNLDISATAGSSGGWTGSAEVDFPGDLGLQITASVDYDTVGFNGGSIAVENIRFPIGTTGAFLQRLAGGFTLRPAFGLTAGAGVGWPAPVGGHFLFEVDGNVGLTFTSPDGTVPGHFHVDGQFLLASVPIGDINFTYTFNGEITFGAHVGIGLPPDSSRDDPRDAPIFIGGGVDGWIAAPQYDIEGNVSAIVLGLNVAGINVLFSNIGIAGCGHIGPIAGGFGYRYATRHFDVMGPFGCDVGAYRPAGSAIGSAAGRSVTLRGARPALIKAYGPAGPPKLLITGPGGRRLAMPVAGTRPIVRDGFVILQDPTSKMTFVGITHPAGRWRLVAEPGSPAISRLDLGSYLPPVSVHATVGGRARARTLSWTLRRIPGQTVEFAELGRGSRRAIVTTARARGRVRFTSGQGPAGVRTIEAIVLERGVPRTHMIVARYRAPKEAKLGRTSQIKVSLSGGRATVTWAAVPEAFSYRIFTTVNGVSSFTSVRAATRRLIITAPAHARVSVTVQAERGDGAFGAIVKGPTPVKKLPKCKPVRRGVKRKPCRK